MDTQMKTIWSISKGSDRKTLAQAIEVEKSGILRQKKWIDVKMSVFKYAGEMTFSDWKMISMSFCTKHLNSKRFIF